MTRLIVACLALLAGTGVGQPPAEKKTMVTEAIAVLHPTKDSKVQGTIRFTQTAEELRKAAHEMERDLTETRAERQKGVLEMPESARVKICPL